MSLSAVAERLREGMNSPLPPSEVTEYQAALAAARAALAVTDFEAARAAGRNLHLDAGIDLTLQDDPRATSPLTETPA